MKLLALASAQSGRPATGGMSEILRGLYVGGFRDARDETQLTNHGITHVLSVHNNPKPLQAKLEYLCIHASDDVNEDLSIYFSIANEFIHEARINGGISRSVTLATAYIMTITRLRWRDALSVVRGARKQAYPNLGFMKLLRTFQEKDLGLEIQRFREKFPCSVGPFDDKEMCDKHMASYRRWLEFGDQLRDEQETWLVEHSAAST